MVQLIDFLMSLPEEDNEMVYDILKQTEEKTRGESMTGFLENKGIKKGKIEGIIEGKIEGKKEDLSLLLETKKVLSVELKNLISLTYDLEILENAFKDFIRHESIENLYVILKK